MNLSPIVLFVYNRPWHTEQTLNALKNNELADQSVLYIYSDGPKENASEEQLEKIKQVREVLRRENWCKEVHIIESEKNRGLADSIITGVTEIVNKYGRIIVLEDDIVTSRGFLKYMNDALNLYENEEKVMHVSGYMYPLNLQVNSETVFLNVVTPWGWATYANRWRFFCNDANTLIKRLNEFFDFSEDDFNAGYGRAFTEQLEANNNGSLKSWAVKWHTSIYLNKGFCLHPSKSLVENIGMDGSGVNCGTNSHFNTNKVDYINVERIELKQTVEVKKCFKEYYESQYKKRKRPFNLKLLFNILKR